MTHIEDTELFAKVAALFFEQSLQYPVDSSDVRDYAQKVVEIIQQECLKAKIEEQENTITTHYKAGDDGYGQIYFIVDGDLLQTQADRIEHLESLLNKEKV